MSTWCEDPYVEKEPIPRVNSNIFSYLRGDGRFNFETTKGVGPGRFEFDGHGVGERVFAGDFNGVHLAHAVVAQRFHLVRPRVVLPADGHVVVKHAKLVGFQFKGGEFQQDDFLHVRGGVQFPFAAHVVVVVVTVRAAVGHRVLVPAWRQGFDVPLHYPPAQAIVLAPHVVRARVGTLKSGNMVPKWKMDTKLKNG